MDSKIKSSCATQIDIEFTNMDSNQWVKDNLYPTWDITRFGLHRKNCFILNFDEIPKSDSIFRENTKYQTAKRLIFLHRNTKQCTCYYDVIRTLAYISGLKEPEFKFSPFIKSRNGIHRKCCAWSDSEEGPITCCCCYEGMKAREWIEKNISSNVINVNFGIHWKNCFLIQDEENKDSKNEKCTCYHNLVKLLATPKRMILSQTKVKAFRLEMTRSKSYDRLA